MMGDSPLGHVHCRRCGREMRPMSVCGLCGEPWMPPVLEPRAPAPPVRLDPYAVPAVARPAPAPTGATAPRAPSTAEPTEPDRRVAPADEPAFDLPAPRRPILGRASAGRRPFRPIDLWKRYLPPVRLVWILLGVIAWFAGGFVSAAQAGIVISVPIIGAVTDLLFQKVRFAKFRFPDAALATSLFLVLLVWPATVDLPLASIAIASVGLRHVLRISGHPLFNPVAAGLTLGAVLFALPNSWHVGVGWDAIALIVAAGVLLVARAPHTWRLPTFYFATYLPLSLALSFALGVGANWLDLFLLGTLAPGAVFFGMFMVTEPRTAPSNRKAMVEFAILTGAASAVLPVIFTEVTAMSALGIIAPFLALFVGNVFTVALPTARGARATAVHVTPATTGRGLPGLSR
jgi:hypothetical protein